MENDEEEESRVATEVENILSGKVLDTDISGIPEIEELMSTESKLAYIKRENSLQCSLLNWITLDQGSKARGPHLARLMWLCGPSHPKNHKI